MTTLLQLFMSNLLNDKNEVVIIAETAKTTASKNGLQPRRNSAPERRPGSERRWEQNYDGCSSCARMIPSPTSASIPPVGRSLTILATIQSMQQALRTSSSPSSSREEMDSQTQTRRQQIKLCFSSFTTITETLYGTTKKQGATKRQRISYEISSRGKQHIQTRVSYKASNYGSFR